MDILEVFSHDVPIRLIITVAAAGILWMVLKATAHHEGHRGDDA